MALENAGEVPQGAWFWLAGLGGAVVSVANLANLTAKQKVTSIVSGSLVAGFLGPAAVQYWDLSARYAGAAHFLIGLGGLTLSGLLLAAFDFVRKNPAALLDIKGSLTEFFKRTNNPPANGGNTHV